MKTQIILALVLGSLSFSHAQEHEVTLDTYLFSVSQLKEVRSDTVDEGYLLLERIVKAGNNVDKATMLKIMKVHLFLLQNDKSNYGAELLAPLFKANKKMYADTLKTFKPIEVDLITQSQKVYERESKGGNG